ncbi:MFS transporter [Rhizosaccharibacter radicis]|uniref:MFS transporter n=1 Tax=Rhizosaccharibacter radicis TaxID=2782605 RepID=A0ABT1W0M4_9PROT|nr:MFS transporter [Acetobacteraceae bacterium KSS12]
MSTTTTIPDDVGGSTVLRGAGRPDPARAALVVLCVITVCHLLNDAMQALLPAVYPLLKRGFHLSFGQLGLLTFAYQVTASLLQPLIGQYTDRRKLPWSLSVGMLFTLCGLAVLALARSYGELVGGALLLGIGSSIFHPESSRIARLSSGGRHGFAQSLFQVGGNAGTALGPLLAAFIVLPLGQGALGGFCVLAALGAALQAGIGRWYAAQPLPPRRAAKLASGAAMSRNRVALAMTVLVLLVFSKYFYLTSITNYYIFFLIHRFGLSTHAAQIDLFVFLGSVAVGTFAGGPIGDRIGRKYVIWVSILGVLPFTLLMPHVGLHATVGLSVVIGLVLSSAFSAILVYATELLPGRVGMVAGLFFGIAFGVGGLGAALLGLVADARGIEAVYRICSFLPALGLLTVLLPDVERDHTA